MSISPQSLAKTRDKRSLRVPRKFEDFEDEYIPGNYAAALRLKGSKPASSKRHLHKDLSSNSITDSSGGSSSKKIALATSPEVAPPVPAKTSRPPPRQRSSTPAIVEQTSKESPPTSNSASPSPTLAATASSATATSTVTITTNAAAAAAAAVVVSATCGTTSTTSTTTTAINTDISVKLEKVDKLRNVGIPEVAKLLVNDSRTIAESNKPDKSNTNTVPSSLFEIDLECKETAPANIDIETKDIEKMHTDEGASKNDDLVTPNLTLRTTGEQTVDLANMSAENLDKTLLNAIRKSDDNVFKKSPFHPSITISNGVRLGGSSTKPLNEKTKLSSVSILSSQASKSSNTTSSSSSSSSTSRKRSRGFSLMVKPQAVQNGTASNQIGNTLNSTNSSSPFQNNTNRPHQLQPQVQVQQQQPTKYFNSLAQNMQYGTRLMLNEPIYLPKSVPTIAPITNTLIHIANQAKKPPYLTKRAEKYYAYQEERKMNILLSNYKALSRVTQFLEAKDLLSLRMVNKTWKSIIDCDGVWQKVLLKRSHICNWSMFVEQVLQKCRVKEIILDEYETNIPAEDICSALAETDLDQISLKTVNENQSKKAIEVLCSLNSKGATAADINWKVKVVVDDSGLALVPISKPIPRANDQPNTTTDQWDLSDYLYSVCLDPPAGDNETVLVELDALRSLFNNGENDEYKTGLLPRKPCITIEPI